MQAGEGPKVQLLLDKMHEAHICKYILIYSFMHLNSLIMYSLQNYKIKQTE